MRNGAHDAVSRIISWMRALPGVRDHVSGVYTETCDCTGQTLAVGSHSAFQQVQPSLPNPEPSGPWRIRVVDPDVVNEPDSSDESSVELFVPDLEASVFFLGSASSSSVSIRPC